MHPSFCSTPRVAVIGTGISGLAAAWLLSGHCEVAVFEAADRVGGHANTVDVVFGAQTFLVDTGFIVFNPAAYPNLTAIFEHLGVVTQPADMSLSVSLDEGALEYSGQSILGLVAQPGNVLRPRFWSMLRDVKRFYRDAPRDLARLQSENTTLGEYLAQRGYGCAFRDDHLLPMAAAIWSAPARSLLDYPAAAFIRFYDNHGLLRLRGRPEWRTVVGGSRTYVNRMIVPIADSVYRGTPVTAVTRTGDGVEMRDAHGTKRRFDHVVIATHADQALALLQDPSAGERELLSAFHYSRNDAVLHTDPALMPTRRFAWASWNYVGRRDCMEAPVGVTYWMNRLQNLRGAPDMFVTLNPSQEPRAGTVLHRETYTHPCFDSAAHTAQRRLWSLQGQRSTWFCGAHFGAGFHEDGLQAGLAVAEALSGARRPWHVANESGRIPLAPVDSQADRERCVA